MSRPSTVSQPHSVCPSLLERFFLSMFFSVCVMTSPIESYETKPWLEEDFVPKYTLSLYGDGFPYVPTCRKTASIDGWMVGIGNGLRMALFGEYALEGEVLASLSACRDFSLEAVRITGRKLLTSDIVGDCYSSTIGFSFTAPTNQALHDINRFYHGRYESELHYAIGREFAPKMEWEHRAWGVGTFGIANQGSPWLRLRLAWEGRFCLTKRIELFVLSDFGLGRHCFPTRTIRSCSTRSRCHCRCPRHFPGYASIRYRFIDAGLIYREEIEDVGDLAFHYTFRPYAHNLPGWQHTFSISLTVPLSFSCL